MKKVGSIPKKTEVQGKPMSLNPKAPRKVMVGKRTLSIVACIVIIGGCLLLARSVLNQQSAKIQIVTIKSDAGPSTLVTEDMLVPVEMVAEDFKNFGQVSYNKNGEKVSEQIYVEWSKKDELVGKYLTYYSFAGSPLTTRMVTKETLVRSAWIDKVEDNMEFYTMTFGEKDVYTPVFYPGVHLRIRMTYDVPKESYSEIREKIREKESQILAGSYVANGESVIVEQLQAKGSIATSGFGEGTDAETLPLSEVIFDDIVVVDMLNNSQESIFDLYVELMGMPIDKRIEYLKTTIVDQGSTDFKIKVTPASLMFVTTREEATRLSEFEQMGAELKYTVLNQTDEDYNLMTQFTEIGNQIQSYIDNAPSTSFK